MSRPVIVLDPAVLFEHLGEHWRDDVLAALRSEHPARDYISNSAIARAIEEQAPPPEPLGMGAVAEDADGVLWVRASADIRLPWSCAADDRMDWASWSEIKVTRVLSEGVKP